MEKAKRARKAETPKQPSLYLRLSAPQFYPKCGNSLPNAVHANSIPTVLWKTAMSFEKLRYATRLVSGNTHYHEIVKEWDSKRQHLAVELSDFPSLIQAYKAAPKEPYEKNKKITLVNPIPRLRLANACEATVNALYSMAEISSHFANRASGGKLPSGFNALRTYW